MRRVIVVTFAFLCVLPVSSQAKHAFTFEDMMALKRVEEPMPSPDGKWVIFGVVDVDLAANSKTPHVWIVPLAGGESRKLIADQDSDRPRWSPDGRHFAFISNKERGSQIWIADFDSASGTVTGVHRLTDMLTEASGEIWSPDGKNIAFTSDVYPECDGAPEQELACNTKKFDEAAKSPVKAQILTRLLYRHWNAYKEGKRTHIFVVSVDGGTPRDLTPGDYDSPVFSLGGQDNYAFSPDGQELCYTSNHDKVEATSTNNDLWIVPVNGATDVPPVGKNITADNPASDSTPLYSPDGKYIAYRAQKRPGYESDRFRLMLYDRKTGKRTNVSEQFDRWIGTFTWAPTSRMIFFSTENEGDSPIYSYNIDVIEGKPSSWPWESVANFNDDVSYVDAGPKDHLLVFTRMSVGFPNEIFKARLTWPRCVTGQQSGTPPYKGAPCELAIPEQLTHINSSVLSQVFISPLEPFWFSGANGDKVEGFLVKPPNFDPKQKYPVKFLIHGGPQGAWGDDWSFRWNPELFAANGYVVIMINFHGSTGYGQKFIDAINGDWGGAPFQDLMLGLDYAEKTYPFIDKDRECALGASYGGYMANWILGHTTRFKCIVTHDGMFNSESAWGTTEELWFNEWEFKGTPYTNREMYRKWSPHLSATNFKTPTLVIHGQRDYRLDVSEGFQLFTTLQRLGVPSKMLYFPDEGHWVLKPQNSQFWYKTVNDWVDQWTKSSH